MVPAARRAGALLLVVAFVLPAAPARADDTLSPAQTLMATCPDLRTLRAALARTADTLRAVNPAVSEEARYWRGVAEARAGMPDSAIADLQRAIAGGGTPDGQLALADALLGRARPADLAAAAGLMRSLAPSPAPSRGEGEFRARLGWTLFLQGHPDSAMEVLTSVVPLLDDDLVWKQRVGRVAAATPGQAALAGELLTSVLSGTRGTDRAAREALRSVTSAAGGPAAADFDARLRRGLAEIEAAERQTTEGMGGRLLRLRASDGFPISGALFAGAAPLPVAVVLMAAGDSIGGYDSLVVALRRAGLAALLVERRGSRGACGPGLALPTDAYGRETALETRIARDALEALRAASHQAPLDTTRTVLCGVRGAAPTAVLAGTLSARARAIMLVSPDPVPTDLGPSCARLTKLRRPVYIVMAPEDWERRWMSEALFQAGPRGACFVADTRAPGRGAEQFRGDPGIAPRLARWLDDPLKHPASATRP
jgi:hypothetical protein